MAQQNPLTQAIEVLEGKTETRDRLNRTASDGRTLIPSGPSGERRKTTNIVGRPAPAYVTGDLPGQYSTGMEGTERLETLAEDIHQGRRSMDDVRQQLDLMAEDDNTPGWDGWEGPQGDWSGMEPDQEYLDEGMPGILERLRQMYGIRGIQPMGMGIGQDAFANVENDLKRLLM